MKRKHVGPGLEPIDISIVFAPSLAGLAQASRVESTCNEGCPFFFILQCVLIDFPAIPKKYPPGALGFTVNGAAPGMDYAMKAGDVVEFFSWDRPTLLHA